MLLEINETLFSQNFINTCLQTTKDQTTAFIALGTIILLLYIALISLMYTNNKYNKYLKQTKQEEKYILWKHKDHKENY